MAFVAGEVEQAELQAVEPMSKIQEADGDAVLLAFDVIESAEGDAFEPPAIGDPKIGRCDDRPGHVFATGGHAGQHDASDHR